MTLKFVKEEPEGGTVTLGFAKETDREGKLLLFLYMSVGYRSSCVPL